jgi:cell division septum initiation protein DivIVA
LSKRALTTGWFEDQDRMTPEEVLTVSFPLTRLGRRGFEEEPVLEFLRKVHEEFVHLVNDRTALWQEVQQLRNRILAENGNNGRDSALFGNKDAHVHAVRILSTAQVTADRYVSDAKAYSSRLTEEARRRRDEILTEAQQYSDMLLEDAHARASEAAATALNSAVPAPSARQRQAAEAELAYLRTFSDVYRSHLRAYTEGILRGIEEWERKEAESVQEATYSLPFAAAPVIEGSAYVNDEGRAYMNH